MGKRRKEILLGALLAVLALVVYRLTAAPAPSSRPSAPSNQRASAQGRRAAPAEAPDVHLEALDDDRPSPGEAERNVFRFKPKPPPPPPRPVTPVVTAPIAPGPPPGPPPPPPITLKFIGVLEQGGRKVATLTDGLGPPMFAVEGGTVAGRYRVLRIGVESIELSYLDGRGRQTIRLTGG